MGKKSLSKLNKIDVVLYYTSILLNVVFFSILLSTQFPSSEIINEVYYFFSEQDTNFFSEADFISFINSSCNSDSIIYSSSCVVNYMKDIYNYTPTGIIVPNYEEIIITGGDCKAYSRLYNMIGEDLGFYSEEITIQTSEKQSHRFTTWSNNDSYCVLDQTTYYCIEFV